MRRRFGYQRIYELLRPQFPGVNHKRVYRLSWQANLAVRRRKKSKQPIHEHVPPRLARTVNEVLENGFRERQSLGRVAPEVPHGR